MPADDRFHTRAFEDGDEEKILGLFAESFPHAHRGLDHFEWKYGARRISETFEGERLVGHYAGYPMRFWYRGDVVTANQIGDTMTAIDVRNAGRGSTSVLARTASHFYANFCEGQVAFNYGFNVSNIQRFSVRFLRSDVVEPVTYRVLETKNLRPISRWTRRARGYQLELVRETNPAWDDFFARVAPAYSFLAVRDAAYVKWRYLDCPDVPYIVVAIRRWRKLAGWIAFRVQDRRLILGDLLLDPRDRDALGVLLRHVVPGYPVDTVEGWFPPRPAWLDVRLRETGFETRPEPQDLSLMCVPFTMPDATARMRESLYYTWGDSDLF